MYSFFTIDEQQFVLTDSRLEWAHFPGYEVRLDPGSVVNQLLSRAVAEGGDAAWQIKNFLDTSSPCWTQKMSCFSPPTFYGNLESLMCYAAPAIPLPDSGDLLDTLSWFLETGAIELWQQLDNQQVESLARVIMSEASIGNATERICVGWTVLNRMRRCPTTEVQDVWGQYAHGQTPTDTIRDVAASLLSLTPPADPTGGATHYYSPLSMPKEGDSTAGFDVGGGLEQVSGLSGRNYRPLFAVRFRAVNVPGVRERMFKFYVAPGTGRVH